MKNLFIILWFLIPFHTWCAADLVVFSGSVVPPSSLVLRGQSVTVNLVVKNIGNLTAPVSSVAVYSKIGTANRELMCLASVKKLAPGESVTVEMIHPVTNTASGICYISATADKWDEVYESDENNDKQLSGFFTLSSSFQPMQHTPYPVILIHGLAGDASTWTDFAFFLNFTYGWVYGGSMRFCLNMDGDTKTSIWANDIKYFKSPLSIGDYYTIDFATKPNGVTYSGESSDTYTIQSNQSAIFKQGKAIKDAVAHVLEVTGSDKVILVGHSMGGLAAREYIQNPVNWQLDGKHHVAKVFTIGTPHGGSNITALALSKYLSKVAEFSEAVRDLRYTEKFVLGGGFSGNFLFGGVESNFYNGLPSLYNSDDVNCNGYVGNAITGLNQKALPADISYSCTIGELPSSSDGVVESFRANLANYTSLKVDTFIDYQPKVNALTQHQELHKRGKNNMRGLDEPYEYALSYDIQPSKLYFGNITIQSDGSPYQLDYDDYKVNLAQKTGLRIRVYNISVSEFYIDVLTSTKKKIATIAANGRGNIDTTLNNLAAGSYFIELSGNPDGASVFFQYAFRVDQVTSTPTAEISEAIDVAVYPNPATNSITIDASHTPSVSSVKITDMTGRLVLLSPIKGITDIDVSPLMQGVYIVSFLNDLGNIVGFKKMVK